MAILVIYVLGFMMVVGLGYFGGRMVYEGREWRRGPEGCESSGQGRARDLWEISAWPATPTGAISLRPRLRLSALKPSDRLPRFSGLD